jgi:hypothetical protein
MGVPAITDITMRNAKVYFGDVATTNLYQVFIGPGWQGTFLEQLKGKGIDFTSFGTTLGLLCADASLPSSTYATAEVKDNFIGVTQEFAHTRIYTDIDFTFYIDHDYNVLRFFEFWMNFISGGGSFAASSNPDTNAFRRFNYPKYYKNSQIYIKKFERDYLFGRERSIVYQFINAFPKSVTSIPVSYGPTDLLKVTVTMNYDRYIYEEEQSSVSGNGASDGAKSETATNVVERPINPATGKPVERTSNFGLSDADWNKAYQEGLSKSAEQINLSRQRATNTGVRGPRER